MLTCFSLRTKVVKQLLITAITSAQVFQISSNVTGVNLFEGYYFKWILRFN